MTEIPAAVPQGPEPQRFVLQGAVNLKTFNDQRAAGEAAIRAARVTPGRALEIDLTQAEASNSLGAALMTAWFRLAQTLGCELSFASLPASLLQILDFTGLSEVLPVRTEDNNTTVESP